MKKSWFPKSLGSVVDEEQIVFYLCSLKDAEVSSQHRYLYKKLFGYRILHLICNLAFELDSIIFQISISVRPQEMVNLLFFLHLNCLVQYQVRVIGSYVQHAKCWQPGCSKKGRGRTRLRQIIIIEDQ